MVSGLSPTLGSMSVPRRMPTSGPPLIKVPRPLQEALVADLYHDLCAGALLPTVAGNRHREVVVPLAHQSALAGIMLATQLLIAESPDLARHRPSEAQARFDVFSPAPPRPVPLGRPAGCICADGAYRTAYESRWPSERAEEVPELVGGYGT